MAKLISLILVIAVVGVCTAVPARLNNARKSRFFARQELAEDVPAQTPYPPAGIRPEVRFDLPNEPQQPEEPELPLQPEQVEEPEQPEEPQQPDNTYLPPDNLLPPAQTYGPPDQLYGPPEASGNGAIADDDNVEIIQSEQSELEDAPVDEPENPQSERIVLARSARKQATKPAKLRAAKLQALPAAARSRSQRLVAQPVYSNKGALVAYRILRV